MTSNQRILDAAVVTYHSHYGNSDRPLRLLHSHDFDRIRAARANMRVAWRKQKQLNELTPDGKITYIELRRAHLERWARKHAWHESTTHLYSSIISILTTWDTHGIPEEHRRILLEARAGVRLWSQFLAGCEGSLL